MERLRHAEGAKILMFLDAANREPGPCVGRHVARMEAEVLLTSLARRVEHIELAAPPRRHLNNTLRSWASLPVRVRPAAG